MELIMETLKTTNFMPYRNQSQQQNPQEKKVEIVTLEN